MPALLGRPGVALLTTQGLGGVQVQPLPGPPSGDAAEAQHDDVAAGADAMVEANGTAADARDAETKRAYELWQMVTPRILL